MTTPDGSAVPPTDVPALPPDDEGEQEQAGLDARHQRVAALLTRLATTARSFLLYDAGNEAIHRFLKQLLDGLTATLDEEGFLEIDVQPFELRFRRQAVYVNRDRERSLAFRLYRDGVRRLTFAKNFDWEELARLIEVLSIRYTRVHQREDDMVTLLWKARFAHLEIAAVEGIVPDEGDKTWPTAGADFALPDDVDLPRPTLPSPVGPTWTAVGADRLEALRAEAAPAAVAADCLTLLSRLRPQLDDAGAPLAFDDVAHLFAEVRDFLLVEDQLASLKAFVALLWEMASAPEPAWDPRRHAAVYELLDTCGDRRAVRRLLRSVPTDERVLRPELVEVLTRACPDPLSAVMDVLMDEQSPAVRAVARQLLEHYGPRKRALIQDRFERSSGTMAADLLRSIANIGGEGAAAFVARQAGHADPAVQDEAIWHLKHMPYSGPVGHALFEAFRLSDGKRRAGVLELILGTRDPRFLDLLAAHAAENAAAMTTDEAARLGQSLGVLGGEASIPRWKEWLKPAGRMRSGFEGPLQRQIVAALALAEIPGEAAAEALGVAFDSANDESQPWILGALAQRQRRKA